MAKTAVAAALPTSTTSSTVRAGHAWSSKEVVGGGDARMGLRLGREGCLEAVTQQ